MTAPNPSLPRLTYAVNRRCAQRCFFLRPSPKANQVVGYCLGVVLAKFPTVRLTAIHVASNHYHALASDDEGDLSSFFRELNGLIARSMNCHLGRGESFWAPGGLPKTGIFDEAALWDQLVYATVNAVKDGLVEEPRDWPGLRSLPEDVGTKVFRFERPTKFFRSEGPAALPPVVEFQLELPIELAEADPEWFRAEYRRRVNEEVARLREERERAGRRVLGAAAVLRQDPRESAGGSFPDRKLNPRVACKTPERRIRVLRWLSRFRLEHWSAWQLWSRGQRDVCFPFGTYLMRLRYRVRCRDPDAPLALGASMLAFAA